MTTQENKQRIKSEALNAISKIYHPLTKNQYDEYRTDGSHSEQRDSWVKEIIYNMESELCKLKKQMSDEDILKLDFYDLCGIGSIGMTDKDKLEYYKNLSWTK